MGEHQTHDLTAELQGCVRAGLKPHLLAQRPAFREWLGIDDEVVWQEAGFNIRDAIVRAIGSVEGPRRFEDQDVPCEVLRECLRILLKLERSRTTAPERRRCVIVKLRVYYAVESWRKLPEYEFLRLLATEMVACRQA